MSDATAGAHSLRHADLREFEKARRDEGTEKRRRAKDFGSLAISVAQQHLMATEAEERRMHDTEHQQQKQPVHAKDVFVDFVFEVELMNLGPATPVLELDVRQAPRRIVVRIVVVDENVRVSDDVGHALIARLTVALFRRQPTLFERH